MQGECIRNRDRGISAEYDVRGVKKLWIKQIK